MKLVYNVSDMFHDESFEGFNFFMIGDQGETYQVEADSEYIKSLRSKIELAMVEGETYLNVRDLNLVYKGKYWDETILEVYWG